MSESSDGGLMSKSIKSLQDSSRSRKRQAIMRYNDNYVDATNDSSKYRLHLYVNLPPSTV